MENREKIRNIKEEEKQVIGTLQEYQSMIKTKDGMEYADGPMCGNCHQREGHNKLNCAYQRCETVFLCGDIAKHAEEKARMKQVEKHHRELLKQITTLENDLKVKEASATSLHNRYVYKVRSMLIESHPSRYLSVGAGGLYVENWFQLNKDARKLQSILKGKVPTSGTNIQKLLADSSDDTLNTSALDKGKTSVRNPYRNLWEQKGVQWPSQKESSTSVTTSSCNQSSLSPPSSLSMDEPQSLLSDEFVLALGIKESLKNVKANTSEPDQEMAVNPQEIEEDCVEIPLVDVELEVSNDIPVLDQSFANIGISNDLNPAGGLNVLADICDRFYAEEELLDDLI